MLFTETNPFLYWLSSSCGFPIDNGFSSRSRIPWCEESKVRQWFLPAPCSTPKSQWGEKIDSKNGWIRSNSGPKKSMLFHGSSSPALSYSLISSTGRTTWARTTSRRTTNKIDLDILILWSHLQLKLNDLDWFGFEKFWGFESILIYLDQFELININLNWLRSIWID